MKPNIFVLPRYCTADFCNSFAHDRLECAVCATAQNLRLAYGQVGAPSNEQGSAEESKAKRKKGQSKGKKFIVNLNKSLQYQYVNNYFYCFQFICKPIKIWTAESTAALE